MPSDESIQKILEDLGRAVARAMSGDAAQTVQKIRREGFSLYLVLDAKGDEDSGARGIELVPKRHRLTAGDTAPLTGQARPSYRLDSGDVTFLRSLGIDPSRTGRQKK